jgi:hypothetical protein
VGKGLLYQSNKKQIRLSFLSNFHQNFFILNDQTGQEGIEYRIIGLSSLGVPGVPWHTQILADHEPYFKQGGQIMAT